jgi:hypothetical protein
MTPLPAAASDTARRLWVRAAGNGRAPEEVAAAAESMCTQLRVGLGRWIGAEGYRALLERALELARAEHPALGGLSCLGGDELVTSAAVRAYGSREVAAGFVGLVAVLIELLGRIIGDEMALRLVAQTSLPSPRRVGGTETEGQRDGRKG